MILGFTVGACTMPEPGGRAGPARQAVCGDGVCHGETCASCALDCCCVPSPSCGGDQCARGGQCCQIPAEYPGQKYGGATYTNWDFGVASVHALQLELCFLQPETRTRGIYYQLYDYPIDGTGMYFGLQTSPTRRNTIFSRFGTTDLTNVREAEGGDHEAGTYEGPFVSVRRRYEWGVGCHVVRLERAEASGEADWFDLSVTDVATGTRTYVGGLRFPRAVPGKPASIANGGGSWVEHFTPEAESVFQLPYTHVTFGNVLADNALRPVHARSGYSERPNSNVFVDVWGRVHHESGRTTPRCNPPGQLF